MVSSLPRSRLWRSTAGPLLVGAVVAGCAGGVSGTPAPPSMAPPSVPTVELELTAAEASQILADAGHYSADPEATLNFCVLSSDGYWRLQYAGGEPWFGVDLLVGPTALTDAPSEDMSAEIQIGSPISTYLWIDQPGHRGGDAPGRSEAVVEATEGDGWITFDVVANTPVRTTGGDKERLDVALTATCPDPA